MIMFPRRELNERFQHHIARARRARIIAGAFLGLCILGGTAAALTQTQLPGQAAAVLNPIASGLGKSISHLRQQAAATLDPIAFDLRNTLSQLPSALSQRISNLTPQLPSGTQLAAAATSFPQSVAEKVRNLFCRWLACENATVQVAVTQQPPQKTSPSYAATLPQNVKQPSTSPPPSPTGDATTTSQVVVSNVSRSSSSLPPTQVINQPIIERVIETTRTLIQGGISEAMFDARLSALTTDLTSRMNSLSSANSAQTTNVYNTVASALRIEDLTGLTAHDLTVDGVTGLTDTDIPDSLTASNYLPLSGGTLTGDLSLSGTLTAGSLSVGGLSSGGAVAAPYFTATSSSATSSFAGSILALGPAQFANSANFFGLTSFGATGTTTIATNGTISTPSIIATNASAASLTAYSASIGTLTATTSLAVSGSFSLGSLTGWLNASNGTVSASSSPTVDYITATSTTATSTFAGGITGPNNFTVQSSSGRVGIGTTTPLDLLGVNGSFGLNAVASNALFNIRGAGSSASLQFEFPDLTTSGSGVVRLFRNTDTNGSLSLKIYKGDNTSATQTWLSGGTGNSYLNALGGSVGIGTTNPTYKLDVSGLGHFTGLVDAANFVATSSSVASTFAGNVGIGTTSPATPLYVTGGSITADSSAAGDGFVLKNNSTLIGSMAKTVVAGATSLTLQGVAGRTVSFLNADGSANITHWANPSGTVLSFVNGAGSFAIGTTTNPSNKLVVAGGTSIGADYNTAAPANGLIVEGNVGIGTTSPGTKLDVYGGTVRLSSSNSAYYTDFINAVDSNNAFRIQQNGVDILHSKSGGGYAGLTLGLPGSTSLVIERNNDRSYFPSGNLGIASSTPWAKLSVTNTGTGPSFVVEDSTSPDTTPFIIDASGNVGIGTTNPQKTLSVTTSGDAIGLSIGDAGSATGKTLDLGYYLTGDFARIQAVHSGTGYKNLALNPGGGNVGIGTTTPTNKLHVYGGALEINGAYTAPTNASGAVTLSQESTFAQLQSFNSKPLALNPLSNTVGVGTTSPWRKFSVTGTVGFDGLTANFGAGSLCLTANKEVVYNDASENCTSSLRATKHDINPLSLDALGMIEGLQPVSFVYNEGNGRTRFGFIAEDTAAVDPHLTTYNANGALTGIDDRAILSVIVSAIKSLATKLSALAETVANFAQSFTTKELIATNANVDTLTVNHTLCLGKVCITEEQFMSVFGASALSQTASASASGAANDNQETTATSTPDAIEPAPAEPAVVEDQPTEPAPLPEVQVSNDNVPAAIIPANNNPAPLEASTTGTE